MDGCVISGGVEGGTEVEGGIGEGRHSEVDGRFRMKYSSIEFSTTGGEWKNSLGST